jgi:hypothetical protein
MINKLIPISDQLDIIKNAVGRKKKAVSEETQRVLGMGRLVLGLCFQLLYYSILDNQENQVFMYVCNMYVTCIYTYSIQ